MTDNALVPHFLYKGIGPVRVFEYGPETDVEVYCEDEYVYTITCRTSHWATDTMDHIDGILTGHTTDVVMA